MSGGASRCTVAVVFVLAPAARRPAARKALRMAGTTASAPEGGVRSWLAQGRATDRAQRDPGPAGTAVIVFPCFAALGNQRIGLRSCGRGGRGVRRRSSTIRSAADHPGAAVLSPRADCRRRPDGLRPAHCRRPEAADCARGQASEGLVHYAAVVRRRGRTGPRGRWRAALERAEQSSDRARAGARDKRHRRDRGRHPVRASAGLTAENRCEVENRRRPRARRLVRSTASRLACSWVDVARPQRAQLVEGAQHELQAGRIAGTSLARASSVQGGATCQRAAARASRGPRRARPPAVPHPSSKPLLEDGDKRLGSSELGRRTASSIRSSSAASCCASQRTRQRSWRASRLRR